MAPRGFGSTWRAVSGNSSRQTPVSRVREHLESCKALRLSPFSRRSSINDHDCFDGHKAFMVLKHAEEFMADWSPESYIPQPLA
eukprot:8904558-Prorocentrum_lima.AAC.1